MQIIPLSEGVFTIDRSKVFVPFDINKDELQARSAGSLLVEVQPFVVITEKDMLLLDTGLGFTQNGEMQLHRNLAEQNIKPGDITKVLLSHLHKDHAGGISCKDRLGHYHLSFPHAVYYVQQAEYNFAMGAGFPSYMTEEISMLENNSQVVFLNEEEGCIDGYIHYKITGAHSACHQVFWIKEGDETVFFGADDAPQLQQMKHRFIAKYDYDGRKAMELRHQWWQEGNEEGWLFLFYHDVKTPVTIGR
ncbi:MBL fold metallo-hydrolase [Parafilimonas sp.]|uniref:MBL fold metallo-hydrolase n=1 Tax=Parafilimonas sp. TaxID=1969739 RepID=UPI0039E3C278